MSRLQKSQSYFDTSAAVMSIPSHKSSVLDLAILDGHIDTNGYTSFFSTFLGRQRERMEVPFLLSVGAGSLDFGKIGKSQKSEKVITGTCINLWLV